LVGALVAGSLFASSTTAVAAGAATPLPAQSVAQVAAAPQVNPWAMLSALSGSVSAAALCGTSVAAAATAAAAAAQPPAGCVLPVVDTPPPPPPPQPVPPVAPASSGFGINPLYLGLIALGGGILLWLLLRHHGGHHNEVSPS
jgi:hypothetical protein